MFNNFIQLFHLSLNGFGVFFYHLTLLLLMGGVFSLAVRALFQSLFRMMEKKSAYWAEMVLKALYEPVQAEIWFFVGLFISDLCKNFFEISLKMGLFDYVFEIGILLGCVWFCVRLLGRICDHWLAEYQRSNGAGELTLDPTSILVIRRVGLIGITLFAVLIVLGILNLPLSGLLTFGGISGAALAFASQSMISNFFGGLFIYFDRPFVIGDWISSPEKNLEGVVEHIGWRLTLIRGLDKRSIYVPNSVFTSTIVVNVSRMTFRRINQDITLRYEDSQKVPEIMEKIRLILKHSPEIDSAQTSVSLPFQNALNNSGITVNISAFTKTTDSTKFKALQHRVLLKVEDMIREVEAKISTLSH